MGQLINSYFFAAHYAKPKLTTNKPLKAHIYIPTSGAFSFYTKLNVKLCARPPEVRASVLIFLSHSESSKGQATVEDFINLKFLRI